MSLVELAIGHEVEGMLELEMLEQESVVDYEVEGLLVLGAMAGSEANGAPELESAGNHGTMSASRYVLGTDGAKVSLIEGEGTSSQAFSSLEL